MDRYGDGTARATVEGNILFPFIPEAKLEDLKVQQLVHFFTAALHSCTLQFSAMLNIPVGQSASIWVTESRDGRFYKHSVGIC